MDIDLVIFSREVSAYAPKDAKRILLLLNFGSPMKTTIFLWVGLLFKALLNYIVPVYSHLKKHRPT